MPQSVNSAIAASILPAIATEPDIFGTDSTAAAGLDLNPPAVRSADTHDRRLEMLREQLRRQNRRTSGPFSHPLAARGPLRKLREHISDLSRLADAAIASSETAAPDRLPTLARDLRMLLQTQQVWTERLENQIWRLESHATWRNRLDDLLRQPPSGQALDVLCEAIARETQSLPSGSLLLPEPGLPLAHNAANASGTSKNEVSMSVGRTLEEVRVAIVAGLHILPETRSKDIAIWIFRESVCRQQDASRSGIPDELAARLAGLARVSDPEDSQTPPNQPAGAKADVETTLERLRITVARILTVVEEASLTAAERLIPPALIEYYSRACQSLFRRADSPEQETDLLIRRAVRALGLHADELPDNAKNTAERSGASTALAHKLRWNNAESTRDRPSRRPRMLRRLQRCDETGVISMEPEGATEDLRTSPAWSGPRLAAFAE